MGVGVGVGAGVGLGAGVGVGVGVGVGPGGFRFWGVKTTWSSHPQSEPRVIVSSFTYRHFSL